MDIVRVLIVDDHTLFRRGLVSLLRDEPGLQVVGAVANGEQALRLAQESQVDVVLMDLKMPDEDGTAVTRRFLAALPGARIIILTVSEDDEDVVAAIRAGAQGYILKNADAEELVRTIHRVYAGGAVLAPAVVPAVLEAVRRGAPARRPESELTPRELEVLELLAQGVGNRQIAAALSITENTVKTHVAHILEKLNLSSRRQISAQPAPASYASRAAPGQEASLRK